MLGTLRWRGRIDDVLARASGRKLRRIDRVLRNPLRLAAFQLLYLDRVPAYAAVSEAVDEARRRRGNRAAGFVNAVLRRLSERPELDAWPVQTDDPLLRLAIETSHPEFLVRRWVGRFGEERARAALTAANLPRSQQLLCFTDRGGRAVTAERLAAEGVETEPAALSDLGLVVRAGDALPTEEFAAGNIYLQDQASQAAALLPPPVPGERVLDAACAPGGKTFALLAAEPRVAVVAMDVASRRLRRFRENLTRLGRRVPHLAGDLARLPLAGGFDRVVVDLPCSGTGTLRQHPELKWRLDAAEIERLAAAGRRLLAAAARAVAPGGLLVAITCSLEPEENEDAVDSLLAARADFRFERLEPVLDDARAAGIFGRGRWRVLTAPDHDGFTVHVARRDRDAPAAGAIPRAGRG